MDQLDQSLDQQPESALPEVCPEVCPEVWQVGDRVRLIALPAYVKTADPMPMLRPPTVLSLGEAGIILARRPGDYWSIRFRQGAYLLDRQYLEKIPPETSV